MLNSSQKNQPTASNASSGDFAKSSSVQEIERMLANQRLTDHNLNYTSSNLHPNSLPNPQPPYLHHPHVVSNLHSNQSINLQYNKQPNHSIMNPNFQQQIPIDQLPLPTPSTPSQLNSLTTMSVPMNSISQSSSQLTPEALFHVANIKKYLESNYENLNFKPQTFTANQQPSSQSIANSSMNNPAMNVHPVSQPMYYQSHSIPSINMPQSNPSLDETRIVNDNVISPHVTGLPEMPIRKQNSPNNIYANSSIVSRYCPAASTNDTSNQMTPKYTVFKEMAKKDPSNLQTTATYKETNIDAIPKYCPSPRADNQEVSSKYCSWINNDANSLYDPVYYRTSSQLSFDSTKDDSITYSTYAPPSIRSSAAGNRQPINAILNNDLEQEHIKLSYDDESTNNSKTAAKSLATAGIIDHLKNEKEVDYLTNLLVKGMNSSTEPDFFGMCYKCGKTIHGEGCTFLSKMFHFHCFTCHICDKTLRGMAFYTMDGKPYCEEDYINTLDKCFVCNKPITDRIIRANGNCYHPNCFCCIECGKELGGQHFIVDYKNRLYCIQDFHEKFAPRCSACNKPIMPENNQLETVRIVCLDRCYHVNCYRCEDCGVLLSSGKDGKACYPLDGHTLCKECNNKRFQQYLTSTKLA